MQKTMIKITDAEWEVMRTVWANESITSKEVIGILQNKNSGNQRLLKPYLVG